MRQSRLELNTKLAEFGFIGWAEDAFDCVVVELMAHAIKVSVWIKTVKREVQAFDSVGNSLASALDGLLDRNELIGEQQSGAGISRVNLDSNVPVLGFRHVYAKWGVVFCPPQ